MEDTMKDEEIRSSDSMRPTGVPEVHLSPSTSQVIVSSSGSESLQNPGETKNQDVPNAPQSKQPPRPHITSWLLSPDLDLRYVRYRDLVQRARLLSLAKRPPDAPITPRRAFHSNDRKKVCEMALANPHMSHKELADLFNTNKTTITRTLKEKDKWLRSSQFDDLKVARNRQIAHGFLEYDLRNWLMDCALSSTIVTDDMIKDKAMTIARGYHLTGGRNKFVCSRTWIRSLKSRYGIVNGCFMDYSASISRKRDQALGYWLVQLPRRSVPELALAFKAARSIQSAPTPLLLSAGDTLETNLSDQERKIESSPSGDVPPIPASSATPTVSAAEQSSPDIILDVDSADLLPVSSVSRIEEYDTDIMCMPDNGLGTCRTLPDQSVSTPDGPHMSNTFFPSDPASASTQLPLTALDPSAFHYDPSLNRITFLNPDRLEDLPLDHFLPTDDVPLLDQGLSTDQFPPLDQIVSPASGPGLPTNQSHALGIYGDDPFLALLTDTDSMSSLLPDPSADCTSLFFPVSHDSVAPGFEPAGADMTSFVPQLMFDGLDVSTFHTMDLTGSGQAEFNAAMLDSWSAITESTM